MKHEKRTPQLILLLASLALASYAPAQTTDDRGSMNEKQFAGGGEISLARSRYTSISEPEDNPRDTSLAQLSRSRPAPAQRPHRGTPPGGYNQHWADRGSAGHALIGAAIGFGLGAALAAKGSTNPNPGEKVRAVFLVGGLGAVLGGLIGAAQGGGHSFAHHRRAYPLQKEMRDPDVDADSTRQRSGGGGSEAERTGAMVPISSDAALPNLFHP